MKTCSEDKCLMLCFSRGLCLKHWKMKYQKPIPTSLKKPNRMAHKRTKQVQRYNLLIRGRDAATSHPICFFCQKPIIGLVSHHHVNKRTGDRLIDEKYLVDAHNYCHTHVYHIKPVSTLLKYEWYEGFLLRLKTIDEKLYAKELYKQVKTKIMTNEQYKQLTT